MTYDCVRTIVLWKDGKLGRSHSRPTFTKRYITILILHPRVPLTHLCVPRASIVTFPALSLCNGTVIRHTERQNAVFLTFLKKTNPSMKIATALNPQTPAISVGLRARRSSTRRRTTCNRCRKPLHTIHRSLMIVEAHQVRKSRTVDFFQRFCRTESRHVCYANEVTHHWSVYFGLVN